MRTSIPALQATSQRPRYRFFRRLRLRYRLRLPIAVVRHRALNVGFVANRTLVYGLFLCAGFAIFALLDLLATKRFARNQFEIGLDVAIALAVGLSFQFVHPRAIRLIDRVFLPERYHAAIALDELRNELGSIRNRDDAPNRAVEAVTKGLMLSSLAIFKRMPDGGFVRFASAGWPKGSAWHIFAGDPLVRSFGSSRRVRSIDPAATEQLRIALEPGRPRVGMSLSPQSPGEALLLVGAHLSGRRPDRDEVRGIASILTEFASRNGACRSAIPGLIARNTNPARTTQCGVLFRGARCPTNGVTPLRSGFEACRSFRPVPR